VKVVQKFLLIISPIIAVMIAGVLHSFVSSNPGNDGVGFAFLGIAFLGVPFVAISGVVLSFLRRNSEDPQKASVRAYLLPAILTWLAAFAASFG
jgi:hypothetical protein